MALIEVRRLTRRLGETVVEDLSFCVDPGKVAGFFGPNGAGKSATMRLMLGLGEGGMRFGGVFRRALARGAPCRGDARRTLVPPGSKGRRSSADARGSARERGRSAACPCRRGAGAGRAHLGRRRPARSWAAVVLRLRAVRSWPGLRAAKGGNGRHRDVARPPGGCVCR